MPTSTSWRGRGVGCIVAVEDHRAADRPAQPGQRLGQLGLAVALHARDAQESRPADDQRDAVHGHVLAVIQHAQAIHLDDGWPPGWPSALSICKITSRPTIISASISRVACAGLTVPTICAAAHHADGVGHGEHFAQLVGDEDDGFALLHHAAHDDEQFVGFLGRQHGGRLIQDQNIRVAIEGLDDLDPLLRAHRQIAHVGIGVHRQAILLAQFADARGRAAPVEHGQPAQRLGRADQRLLSQHDVFGDGERRHEHEVLVHHADAVGNGIVRADDLRRLPVDVIWPSSGW